MKINVAVMNGTTIPNLALLSTFHHRRLGSGHQAFLGIVRVGANPLQDYTFI
jgi:hypothetical protein